MDPFKKLLESELLRILLALAGLGGIVRLIDRLLPAGSVEGKWLTIGYLGFAVFSLAIYLFMRMVRSSMEGLTTRVEKVVSDGSVRTQTQIKELGDNMASQLRAIRDTQSLAPEDPPEREMGRTTELKSEAAYRVYAERYGSGIDDLTVECAIRSDGSAEVQRVVMLTAYSQTRQLETALVIPDLPPEGTNWDIENVNCKSRSEGRNVSAEIVVKENRKLSARIEISPQLAPGDQLSYELVEKLPAGLFAIGLTPQELANRQPYDYFGWNISRPTRMLQLCIYFPQGTKPNVYDLEVRYSDVVPGITSKTSQPEEEKRLQKPIRVGPQGGVYNLKLDVPYPMVGLTYILRWKPVPKTP